MTLGAQQLEPYRKLVFTQPPAYCPGSDGSSVRGPVVVDVIDLQNPSIGVSAARAFVPVMPKYAIFFLGAYSYRYFPLVQQTFSAHCFAGKLLSFNAAIAQGGV